MKYILGLALVIFSIFIIGGTYLPIIRNEVNYQINRYQSPQDIQTEPLPLDTEFGIVISKINANAHVVKGVDPYNAQEYQSALSQGVAHAKGSKLPGDGGNIFIFSHSSVDFFQASRFNSIFYLLNKLKKDDIINIFYQGKEYIYLVNTKQIVPPTAIDFLTYQPDKETLTLMTCWPPGTSINRLIVQADLQISPTE